MKTQILQQIIKTTGMSKNCPKRTLGMLSSVKRLRTSFRMTTASLRTMGLQLQSMTSAKPSSSCSVARWWPCSRCTRCATSCSLEAVSGLWSRCSRWSGVCGPWNLSVIRRWWDTGAEGADCFSSLSYEREVLGFYYQVIKLDNIQDTCLSA